MKTEHKDGLIITMGGALMTLSAAVLLMATWCRMDETDFRAQSKEINQTNFVTVTNSVAVTNYEVEVFTVITNYLPSITLTNPFIFMPSNCLIQCERGISLTNFDVPKPDKLQTP